MRVVAALSKPVLGIWMNFHQRNVRIHHVRDQLVELDDCNRFQWFFTNVFQKAGPFYIHILKMSSFLEQIRKMMIFVTWFPPKMLLSLGRITLSSQRTII